MNILAEPLHTPEDLLRMDEHCYELVDGRLVEKAMGVQSSRVGMNLGSRLDAHAGTHQLGLVFPSDCGYQCFPTQPNRVRKPDFSFVRRERLGGEPLPGGWFRIRPDLVVEVISPNDLAHDITTRVTDYLDVGVPLVWVIDPRTHLVQIFRQGGSGSWLVGTGELSGEDMVPGFVCRIEELFVGV
jgi:Uma2 family endonuclease